MKIRSQEELEKLFDLIESGDALEDEINSELKDIDQEIIDLYMDVDSF
jgi:hypothetical protein